MVEEQNNRFISGTYSNVKSSLIEITEDKLNIIVNKYSNQLRKTRDWVGYSSILVTILLSLLTCDFNNNFLGISSDIWYALFVIGFIVSAFLLLISIYNAVRFRNISEKMIKEIKNEDN